MYSWSAPRNKYSYYTVQFGTPLSNFSTVNHHHHRLRRQPQNSFFSKASIQRLSPLITTKIAKFCARIDAFAASGQPMPLNLAYRCLTTDVVTLYGLNKSWDYLDSEDFSPRWHETIRATATMGHLIKQANWILPLVRALPNAVMRVLSPDMMLILEWQKVCITTIYFCIANDQQSLLQHIQKVIDDRASGLDKHDPALPRTIFHSLLDSDLPLGELTKERLAQEAQVILGAGADTTAHAMVTITFFILSSQEVLGKLKREVLDAFPDGFETITLPAVEKLPYLAACIQEGLR